MFNPLSLFQAATPAFWYKVLAIVVVEAALMGGSAWYAYTSVVESQVTPLKTAIKAAEDKALELKLRVDAASEEAARELVMKDINEREHATAILAEYKRQHPDGGKRPGCTSATSPVPYQVLSDDARATLNLLIQAPATAPGGKP